ncbi:MAG: hypothetical protein R3F33_09970 [Planctomycetota bacterium]
MDAQLLAGLLKAEGIEARVAGEMASDEFSMASKMSGVEVGCSPRMLKRPWTSWRLGRRLLAELCDVRKR